MSEVFDVGLPELLDDEAVVLVEWGDAIAPAVPADYLEVRLTLGDGDDDRTSSCARSGRRGRPGPSAVATVLAPWTVDEDAG